MRVLITGGAGFIGSHLAARLLDHGHEIVIADNLESGKIENLPKAARFYEIDVATPEGIRALPEGKYDAVCHLAAQSSGEVSGERPLYDLQVNAGATLLLSRWCLENGISRFLYASSMVAYGDTSSPKVSEDLPSVPISYYGVSKLTSEHLLRLAAGQGLSVTCFRMFSVYGPRQDLENMKQGMVSIFLAMLLKNAPVVVKGSLNRFRDFIYIDDVIDAWVSALEKRETPRLAYNLGTGHPTTVGELIEALIKGFDLSSEYPVHEQEGSASDQFGAYADITSIRRDLEWAPRTSLQEGLSKMIAWAKGAVA